MKAVNQAAPRKGIFYGWWIVAANAGIAFYLAGTYYYSFGAFINPLKDAFGWSTTQISLAFSIRSLEAGPIAPVAGHAVDRFGARAVTLFGVCVTGLGFLLLSQINSLAAFYAAWIIMSVGTSACLGTTAIPNIANWFIRKRGRAMGLYSAGAGLSGILVLVVTWLLHIYGWRNTLLIMAIGTWLICIPMALVLRHRPEKYGLLPDGEESSVASTECAVDEVEGFTTGQAIRTRSFWLLSLAFLLSSAALTAVTVFLIPYLTDPREDNGLALTGVVAGGAMTIVTLCSLVGRLGFGWMSDYRSQRYMLIGLFAMEAAGLFVLAFVDNMWHLVPFFLLFASSYGGILVLRPVILASYFGRRSIGAIQGWSLAISTIGSISIPLLVGTLRDSSGGYQWPFLVLSLTMLLSIPLLLLARRPRIPASSPGLESVT